MSIPLAEFEQFENLNLKDYDYDKCVEEFAKNEKKLIRVFHYTVNKSNFQISMDGEVVTNGVSVTTWDNGNTSYSLGVKFTNEVVYEKLETLLLDAVAKVPTDWDVTPIIKEEILYIKLKPKNDKKTFALKSNIKLEIKKIHEADITRGQEVKATFSVAMYFNMKQKKAGVVLTVTELIFQ